MNELLPYQYGAIGLIFIWSGFVRSGLGFGGAVLSLPFLLMVVNEPIIFLPLIGVHLLLFSAITVIGSHLKASPQYDASRGEEGETLASIDWGYLKYALAIMIIPKLMGVMGVITLPAQWISTLVFGIVTVYAVSYILNRPFHSNNRWVDALFLMIGGYISGTSLIGAHLVIPVFAARVARHQLRDTLFVLWFILVAIKLCAFIWAGVDLQLQHHLWLLPCAALGHVVGLRFHRYTLRADTQVFFRVIGFGLLAVSLLGAWNLWLK